jgi:hypothetical protein
MPGLVRQLLIACVVATAWLSPAIGHAWIETRVESSQTALDLTPDGAATVQYQLMLDVRGAALKGFALDGVDIDAEPLPDATITRMKAGIPTSLPLPVQIVAAAGRLEITVPLKKGFSGRTFLLKLSYRTRLLDRGLIRHLPGEQRSELAWLGPRFADGVDSVTLLVRTAAAGQAPEAQGTADSTANFGIVMSTLRRSQARDELELVRAHVARDEAITWRVLLDRGLFPGAVQVSPMGAASPPPVMPNMPAPAAARSLAIAAGLPWILLAGVAYALLVALKSWRLDRAARIRNCRPRPFVAWRARYRAAVAGLCLGASAAAVVWLDAPVLAAGLLVVASAFAAQRPPAPSPELRGPGQWQPIDADAFRLPPAPAVPGAWLDAGRIQGFSLLLAALTVTTWAAARWFESSPYYGACLLLGSSALLPLFCTGRLGEMPLDALAETQRFLNRAQRRLGKSEKLVTQLMGRFAAQGSALDELRLSIMPARGLPGLIGLELGMEFQERLGGFCARPVVVVRAAEGSPSQKALPRGLMWTRGRSAEERATLVKPLLPTVQISVALVQELLSVMEAPEAAAPSSSRKAASSGGKGLSTAKAGTRSSPAHAT